MVRVANICAIDPADLQRELQDTLYEISSSRHACQTTPEYDDEHQGDVHLSTWKCMCVWWTESPTWPHQEQRRCFTERARDIYIYIYLFIYCKHKKKTTNPFLSDTRDLEPCTRALVTCAEPLNNSREPDRHSCSTRNPHSNLLFR